MSGDGAERDTRGEAPAGRTQATRPLALVATGVLSLLIFAAGGWWLRGLREGRTTGPRVLAVAPDRGAWTRQEPQARGQLVFQVHCARCHGREGRGDGPDAATLRPPPRDLTAPPWHTAPTRDSVRKTVIEGVPGTMMNGLAAALSPRELEAVVDFVLSIAPEGAKGTPLTRDAMEALKKAGFTPTSAGRAAPPLSVRGAEGESVTLNRLRGRLVLIVFWGTSCAPCLKELPDLERLADRQRGEDLAVVPVCVDEADAAVAQRVATDRAPRLPVYIDPTGASKRSYDVQALPAAVLVAPDGCLLGRAQGSMNWSAPEVDTLIHTILHPGAAPTRARQSSSATSSSQPPAVSTRSIIRSTCSR